MTEVELRDVTEDDLAILFEHQADPLAAEMAAFPIRTWAAFVEHWRTKVFGDATAYKKAVLVDGRLVGSVLCWVKDGEREVGYWIGRDHWGRGIASAALTQFLQQMTERPVVAVVAQHNRGSLRVLEKSGFTVVREQEADGVTEVVLTLAAGGPSPDTGT